MRLICFNGSPRGIHSNTRLILNYFNAGLRKGGYAEAEFYYLNRENCRDKNIKLLQAGTHIIIALPLYVDSMPSKVKRFFEDMAPLRGKLKDKHIGFIVQSGFPEPLHSRYIEKYLENDKRNKFAFYICGACYYQMMDYKSAVENYEKSLEIDPNFTDALFASGMAYKKMKKKEQAVRDFEKAINIDPENKMALFELKQLDKGE